MDINSKTITEASRTLREIAKQLVEECPIEMGQEIALIGSAGWGMADEQSDIDLEFWVDKLPPSDAIMNWLQNAGVMLLTTDKEASSGDGPHLIGRYQGVWLELSWSSISTRTGKLQTILTGEALERSSIGNAWNIAVAMPLRAQGLIGNWQRKVSDYPDIVQSRLIAPSSEFWQFPHHVEMLWTLARRQELLGLDEWLFADLQDALRILFAVNRQWEPDWKNLRAASEHLSRTPKKLVERINEIFLTSTPETRIERTLRLVLDVLALVPKPYDISAAKANIEASLHAHCT